MAALAGELLGSAPCWEGCEGGETWIEAEQQPEWCKTEPGDENEVNAAKLWNEEKLNAVKLSSGANSEHWEYVWSLDVWSCLLTPLLLMPAWAVFNWHEAWCSMAEVNEMHRHQTFSVCFQCAQSPPERWKLTEHSCYFHFLANVWNLENVFWLSSKAVNQAHLFRWCLMSHLNAGLQRWSINVLKHRTIWFLLW